MQLQFTVQQYQTDAVDAVVEVFAGQPCHDGGTHNAEIALTGPQLLRNVHAVQRARHLPLATALADSAAAPGAPNLDVEMETGTGKTYVYIKTIMELHRRYGWSKFVVVVPSVAIREGVQKSFAVTAEHFRQAYGSAPRSFTYHSAQLHELERFRSDAGVQVMIINIQAFNATAQDSRRIYDVLDEFQSRRPIDVISATRPIVIIDEPQKIGAARSLQALSRFAALAVLRYSATHAVEHTTVHRLDALEAYTQKLVKRIAVRGITVRGLTGSTAYLYLDAVETGSGARPRARVEIEVRSAGGPIRRQVERLGVGADLHAVSRGIEAYRGLSVTEVDATRAVIVLSNGDVVVAGQLADRDVTEETTRRLQIREVVRAHLGTERALFARGVKVLSLLFVDAVVKYRDYDRPDTLGAYARAFEEEYTALVAEILGERALNAATAAYQAYLRRDGVRAVHRGYFAIDRRTRRAVDPAVSRRGADAGQSTDTDAYDLILRDKERLLSLAEPVRFLFSHSALREGWDNPNVFVMGMLKKSDNTISRRQEIGRGLRLAVDQHGARRDQDAVPVVDELTVVTDESYTEFVAGLQRELSTTPAHRAHPPLPTDARRPTTIPLHEANFARAEFRALWARISRKAVYRVAFDSTELVSACIRALDGHLVVPPTQYVVQAGTLRDGGASAPSGTATRTEAVSAGSRVGYDLLGEVAATTRLTRRTVAAVLGGIAPATFAGFRRNPERFIAEAARLITAEKARVVVEHLTYDTLAESFDDAVFRDNPTTQDITAAGPRLTKHVYDHVVTDSPVERAFVTALESSAAVVVYAQLPRGFVIPTPLGDHTPGWAIAFRDGVAVVETGGAHAADGKIACARRFFARLGADDGGAVTYGVVTDYAELMALVGAGNGREGSRSAGPG